MKISKCCIELQLYTRWRKFNPMPPANLKNSTSQKLNWEQQASSELAGA
jgi:hypothetical protein